MAAVKMAAMQHALAVDDGIVVGAVEFIFDQLAKNRLSLSILITLGVQQIE
jgi:hypothetical protein